MKNGFTLIEILVAIAIFSIALLILLGLFANFTVGQRQAIDQQKLQEGLRFALEQFAKEIRTAYGDTFALSEYFSGALTFRNQAGACVRYYLFERSLTRATDLTVAPDDDCSAARNYNADSAVLTSPRTFIADANFSFKASELDETSSSLVSQGFVTLNIKAFAARDSGAALDLQTTITSRQLIPYAQ